MSLIGTTWRKTGPYDWWRVTGTQLPGDPHYDGGLSGVSVLISRPTRLRKDGTWGQRWQGPFFVPAASADDFQQKAEAGYRRLAA